MEIDNLKKSSSSRIAEHRRRFDERVKLIETNCFGNYKTITKSLTDRLTLIKYLIESSR